MKRVILALGLWAAFSAATCGLVVMLSGMFGLAAWFTLGDMSPPFPWFIVRFFCAMLIQLSAVAAIGTAIMSPKP